MAAAAGFVELVAAAAGFVEVAAAATTTRSTETLMVGLLVLVPLLSESVSSAVFPSPCVFFVETAADAKQKNANEKKKVNANVKKSARNSNR